MCVHTFTIYFPLSCSFYDFLSCCYNTELKREKWFDSSVCRFWYGIFVLSIMNYSNHGWCDHSKIDSTCFNKNLNCVQEFGFYFIRMFYLSIGQTNNIINDEHVLFIFNKYVNINNTYWEKNRFFFILNDLSKFNLIVPCSKWSMKWWGKKHLKYVKVISYQVWCFYCFHASILHTRYL